MPDALYNFSIHMANFWHTHPKLWWSMMAISLTLAIVAIVGGKR